MNIRYRRENRKFKKLQLMLILPILLFLISITSPTFAGYEYMELAPDGLENVVAWGINNSGEVVGWGFDYDAGLHRGFLYSGGTYTILLPTDAPVNWIDAWGTAVNNSGDVVGYGQYQNPPGSGQMSGFLYSGGTYTEIRPPGSTAAEASGIDDNGDVVGNGYGYPSSGQNSGFLYSGGNWSPLLPSGWEEAYATAINNSGEVVGWGYQTGSPYQEIGFLYIIDEGEYIEIRPPDWYSANALGINDMGEVVGFGNDGSGYLKSFIYSGGTEGTYTILEDKHWDHLKAYGINNMGDVVGIVEKNSSKPDSPNTVRGFISQIKSNPHEKRTYTDLPPKGWFSSEAYGINDNGDVVGTGYKIPGGNFFGFIATPSKKGK
jgi:uncharacterized membrane protein